MEVRAAKGGKPVVTEASGHHSEGASQASLFSLFVVALNRKPTVVKENDGIVRASVNKVNKRGGLGNILEGCLPRMKSDLNSG